MAPSKVKMMHDKSSPAWILTKLRANNNEKEVNYSVDVYTNGKQTVLSIKRTKKVWFRKTGKRGIEIVRAL